MIGREDDDDGGVVLPMRPEAAMDFEPTEPFAAEKSRFIEALERRLVMSPTHAPTRTALRDLLLEREEHHRYARDPALAELRRRDAMRVVEVDEDCAAAWAARGAVQERKDDALADLTRAIELDPDEAGHWRSRAFGHVLAGRDLLAALDYGEAYARSEAWEHLRERVHCWRRLGRLDAAMRDLDVALAAHGPTEHEVYEVRCMLRARFADDHRGALADADAGVAAHPDEGSMFSLRGRLREALDELEGAESDFTRAIALRPGSAMYWTDRAELRARRGDVDGAFADWTQAIAIDPTSAHVRMHCAEFLMKSGRNAEALAELNRAVKLERADAELYTLRSACRSRLGHAKSAIADATRAVNAVRDDGFPFSIDRASALFFRSQICRKFGDGRWLPDLFDAAELGHPTAVALAKKLRAQARRNDRRIAKERAARSAAKKRR